MKILINEDIEDKDFRADVFYHYTYKQLAAIVCALIVGGLTYLACYTLGANTALTDLLMFLFCAPIILVGFFEKQGYGFIDYVRKIVCLKLIKKLHWVSTEDVEPVSTLRIKYLPERRNSVDKVTEED